MGIRMIVTDLDGTLLAPDSTISDRNLAAIAAARAAGMFVLAATGRSIVDVRMLPPTIAEVVVCSNGAVTYDAAGDKVLASRNLDPAIIAEFLATFEPLAPGVRFATLTNGGYDFRAGPGYLELMRPGDHGRNRAELVELPLAEMASEPAVKLVARHPEMSAEQLFELSRELAPLGVHPTTSGAPFLELAAAGISKASTLAQLAADRGIDPAEVVVFGDSANDVEMLSWAGHGVAMANGVPVALAVADEIAPANTEDGVAVVLERLLGI